jgi:hypothetical protein
MSNFLVSPAQDWMMISEKFDQARLFPAIVIAGKDLTS